MPLVREKSRGGGYEGFSQDTEQQRFKFMIGYKVEIAGQVWVWGVYNLLDV